MQTRLERFKPRAPWRMHLFLAAATWTVVGIGLLVAGARWSAADGAVPRIAIVLAAIGLGLMKAWLVIRGAAKRVASRIRSRGDGRCLGGFLSWPTWLLVLCMSVAGRALRLAGLPEALVALLYLAVGTALCAGSLWLWRAWRGPVTGAEPGAA